MASSLRPVSGLDLDQLLAEKRRRQGVLSKAHPKQQEAILHDCRYKAFLTPRRAGKTTTCVIDACTDQATHPGSLYIFIALTRPSAEQIAWPIIREIDREFNLGCHFQEDKLRVTFPNEARLRLVGADQKDWMHRLRGVKARRIYIDESAFYRVNLFALIDEVLGPSLMDEDGSLYLVGTPGPVCAGAFYDITKGKVPGWETFTWSTLDNPAIREQYIRELEKKKAQGVDIEKDPAIRREYFGEWVEDEQGRVYVLAPTIEKYEFSASTDKPILAVDFGYKEDQTSFTVACYSSAHSRFVILESWKQEKMLLPDIAEEIEDYERKYPGLVTVADPASAQLVDELRQRFNLRIYEAEKTDKFHWIKLYNSDAASGQVEIVGASCVALIKEQKELQKHVRNNGQWKEWPGQPNDCCDSTLYAFRHAYHYRYSEPIAQPIPGSREAVEKELDEYWEEEAERLEEAQRKRRF